MCIRDRFRSSFDLGPDWDFDMALRYVDELESIAIDDYFELDLSLSWHARENLSLSVVGRNLLDSSHAEYSSDFVPQPIAEIERQVSGQLRYHF